MLGGIFELLLLCQIARGWLEGLIQPVILSVQARAVGRHQQGAVVGLRQTGQRLSSILIPPVMGGVADWFGTSNSFLVRHSNSFLVYVAFMRPLCGLLADDPPGLWVKAVFLDFRVHLPREANFQCHRSLVCGSALASFELSSCRGACGGGEANRLSMATHAHRSARQFEGMRPNSALPTKH